MKKMLYQFLTLLVIASMLLNNIPPLPALAKQAGQADASAEIDISGQTILAQKAFDVITPGIKSPPVATPAPVKVQIPATGGTIRSAQGEFSITFSKSFGTAFSAILKSASIGNAPMRGMHSIGTGYSLGAQLANGVAIHSFTSPTILDRNNEKNAAYNFTIRVKYTKADILGMDETTLGIYTHEQSTGKWRMLPGLIDLSTNTITAQADQPGDFVVFAKRTLIGTAQAKADLKLVIDPDDDDGYADWEGVRHHELDLNVQLAQQVRQKLIDDACTVDVLLTREVANPKVLSRPFRAQQATNFGANTFITFGFNTVYGYLWGWEGDGGIEAWARNGQPNDDAQVNQFYSSVTDNLGRPHNKATEHPSRYPAFNALPASLTYAHIEMLFMDHNYDGPIIYHNFEYVTNAAYIAIRSQLETKGMVCGKKMPAPPSAAELQRLRDLGYQNYLKYGADPVSFSTGNHVVRRDLFSLPEQGHTTFNFSLTYNSQDPREGYAGIGWSAPIPYIQLYNDDSVTVTLADGRTYYFTSNGGDGYNTPDDLHATLTRTSDGWQWADADGSSMTFTEAAQGFGPMTENRDRHGNTYQYEYDFEGQAAGSLHPNLLKITDTVGRVINFQSDADGHITSISLPGNRTYQLEYTNSDLTQLTDPNGNSYHYQYDNLDRLIKQWDPAGYLFLQNTYDDQNRVIKQIDTNGSVLTLTYGNRVTTYKDNSGNVTQYFFDEQNRVTSIKDALGQTTSTVYDSQDNVTDRSDKRGNHFTFNYDSNGHPLTASGPNGYSASYTYTPFGEITSIKDNGGPNGQLRSTIFTVNALGDTEAIQYADGSSIQMGYDSQGNLKTSKDEKGNVTSYDYDSLGNLTEITNPLGGKTRFTYDDAGRKTSMTDANGHLVKFSYDANSNITRIIDPKGNQTSFVYDENDNLIKMVDRRGGISRYSYDENLKLASETDPEGNVTRYAYDAMYNLIRVTDPMGNITRYKYNTRYEVEQIQSARNGLTRFVYDADGNVTQLTDALGQVTRFEYNGLNLPTAEIDPLNGRTSIGYDAVGHRVEQTNPRGAKTSFVYDLRDRVIEIHGELNWTSKIAYDPAGNPTTYTDANNHSSSLAYNALNQVISSTDAAGRITRFELDAVGNLQKVTDALGRMTTYGYDENDHVASILDALGKTTQFVYDNEDNLKAARDARGNLTRFAYDLNGLMTQMTEAGGQISKFAYDGNGNLTQFTNAKGNSWSFAYDALNQRTRETDPLNQTTQYRYDLLGRLTGTTDAKNVATRYSYDALNHLVTVLQNDSSGAANFQTNVTTRYQYDEVGNLKATIDANGNSTLYTYDLLNRLTQEQNALGNARHYDYDSKGNLTQRKDENGDQTRYSYTVTDLLEQVSYPDHTSAQYTYDEVGNQLSANTSKLGTISNQYDGLNRLLSSTDSAMHKMAYQYDEVGNQTSITYPDGKTVRYGYDSTNYLAQVIDPQGQITKITRDGTHNATLIENPNQTLANYAFDKAEQLKSVTNLRTNGDLINSFTYKLDAVGNRIQTDATYPYKFDEKDAGIRNSKKVQQLTTQYQYDPLYRLTSSSDSVGRNSVYSYDAVGNRTKLITNTAPAGNPGFESESQHHSLTLNYTYNQINALMKITQGDATRDLGKVSAALNAFINQVKAQSGKQIVSATADALIQAGTAILTQIKTGSPDQQTLKTAIAALSQQVQTARQQNQIKSDGVSKALLAKLKECDDGNQQSDSKHTQEINFKYDQNGNRIEQWIARFNGRDVQPNDHGQHGVSIKYRYDFENRLVNVSGYLGSAHDNMTAQDKHPQIGTSMVYDAYGRLFERSTTPGNSGHDDMSADHDNGRKAIQFVYDGLDPVAEYGINGRAHDDSNNGHDDHSVKHTNYYRGDGRILSMLTDLGSDNEGHRDSGPKGDSSRTQYFHYDGLNSVTAITNQKGQRAESYQYADFGAPLGNNGHIDSASQSENQHNHYTYTSQEFDSSTSLYHFYAREYDPSTGTWLQQDPYRGELSDPMSLHRYGYVYDNPINYTDQYGYFSFNFSVIGQKIGNAIGNVTNGVKNAVSNVANGVKNAVSNVANGIKNVVSNVVYGVKNVVSNVANGIKNVVSNVVSGVKNVVKKTLSDIKNAVVNSLIPELLFGSYGLDQINKNSQAICDIVKKCFPNDFQNGQAMIKAIIYDEQIHLFPPVVEDLFGGDTVGLGQISATTWSNKLGYSKYDLANNPQKNIMGIAKILLASNTNYAPAMINHYNPGYPGRVERVMRYYRNFGGATQNMNLNITGSMCLLNKSSKTTIDTYKSILFWEYIGSGNYNPRK